MMNYLKTKGAMNGYKYSNGSGGKKWARGRTMYSEGRQWIDNNEWIMVITKTNLDTHEITLATLLVYIQREMTYDIFDGMPSYERAMNLLKRCMDQIEADEMYDNTEVCNVFENIGFTDAELEEFGFKYLIKDEEEE